MITYLVLAICLGSAFAEQKSYAGYKVFLVEPVPEHQYDLLKTWENKAGIDFWDGLRRNQASRIMVGPEQFDEFAAFIQAEGIPAKVVIEDVEKTLEHERRMNNLFKSSKEGEDSFTYYWTLEEIYAYMDRLAVEYPHLVRVYDMATTYEGRIIKAMTISLDGSVGNNPMMMVDGTIHAREWISPMTVAYLVYQLVERSTENMDLLENVDWVIVPVVNPDGYVYSHVEDRFWRKNRVPQPDDCMGVDLNRNFGHVWVQTNEPCSLTNPGQAPFSEVETTVLKHILTLFDSAIIIYAAMHSYGNYVLYPYSYAVDTWVPNWVENQEAGEAFANAVFAVNGQAYRVGNTAEVLYTSNGSSKDYAAYFHAIRIAYTIELNGGGTGGFDLPPEEIYKSVTEVFQGFRALAAFTAATSNE